MSSIVKRSIDAKTAQKAIEAAAAKARELGLHMCIAVTDESGDLKAFYRMDGAPKLSIQIAEDKAYTAPVTAYRPTSGTISSRTIRRCSTASCIRPGWSCSVAAIRSRRAANSSVQSA
jgi:uncharacterized protein GlcG (DUF336 family)